MTRSAGKLLATIAATALLAGCGTMGSSAGWTTLVDAGKGMDNFTRVGDANWTAIDGALQATQGGKDPAYLVSKQSYTNFEMRVEFWASDDANSGVFMRCQDRNTITDENCYEANIFDQRPDPTYGTGAIVKVARSVSPMPKAGGKWNTYEITVRGTAADARPERRQDGRRAGLEARQRAVRAAMGAGNDQVPQGPDPGDLRGGRHGEDSILSV